MNDDIFTFGIMYLFFGVTQIVFCIALIRDEIPMNKSFGIRTSEALKSKENWSKINIFGGKAFLIYGMVLILVGTIDIYLVKTSTTELSFWVWQGSLSANLVLIPIAIAIWVYDRRIKTLSERKKSMITEQIK